MICYVMKTTRLNIILFMINYDYKQYLVFPHMCFNQIDLILCCYFTHNKQKEV